MKKRNRLYLSQQRRGRNFARYLIGNGSATDYNLVEKLKIKKGGKLAAEVYIYEACANMKDWEMCP